MDEVSDLGVSGKGIGDNFSLDDLSLSTYAEGKIPCFPARLRPVHQSAFVSLMISMISPARKFRSLGSSLVQSHKALASAFVALDLLDDTLKCDTLRVRAVTDAGDGDPARESIAKMARPSSSGIWP